MPQELHCTALETSLHQEFNCIRNCIASYIALHEELHCISNCIASETVLQYNCIRNCIALGIALYGNCIALKMVLVLGLGLGLGLSCAIAMLHHYFIVQNCTWAKLYITANCNMYWYFTVLYSNIL